MALHFENFGEFRIPRDEQIEAYKRIIQACGRVCRSPTDHGVTYVLDGCFANLYRRHHARPRLPHRRARFNGFIHRHALAALLYFLRWVREGSPLEKAAKKVRNDIVDVSFATYGSFFNGVMTDDAKVRELQMELRVVLGESPARMPPEYPEGFVKQIEEIVGPI